MSELIVQFLHSGHTVETVFCLQRHHCTAAIVIFGRPYRSVSLYNLSGTTGVHVSVIRCGEKCSSKTFTILCVEVATLFGVLGLFL